jgi:hypothetical protein
MNMYEIENLAAIIPKDVSGPDDRPSVARAWGWRWPGGHRSGWPHALSVQRSQCDGHMSTTDRGGAVSAACPQLLVCLKNGPSARGSGLGLLGEVIRVPQQQFLSQRAVKLPPTQPHA